MMNRSIRRLAAQGFTLIELLIVVIIIAILAAIAIPQFANTSSDAQGSALSANLNTMRSAVELYRVQHKNVYPSVNASSAPTGCPGTATAGTGAATTDIAFKDQLTMFSDAAGNTCSVSVPASGIIYGPYLRSIPAEPISNANASVIKVLKDNDAVNATPDGTGGWVYDSRNGRLIVNNNTKDSRNVVYSTY
jgi:general secretion pathway protein G